MSGTHALSRGGRARHRRRRLARRRGGRPGPRQDEGDRRRPRGRAAHACSAVTIVDWTTNNMLEHIYDRLLDRDARPSSPSRCWPPSWKIVNDTTWEFKLRQGVKFHNGEPFTAPSVKATIDYALDPATKTHFTSAAYWGLVKEVADRQRLHRALRHQAAVAEPGRQRARRRTRSSMPAKALKELGPARARREAHRHRAVPFVQWKRDERLVLERNPDYWQGPADASRVTFRFIPEFSARMAALLVGRDRHHEGRAAPRRGGASRRAARATPARHGVLAHQLPGAREPQARARCRTSACARR